MFDMDSPMDGPFAHLNPAQAQAVAHGDGPLLVLAGAGTGKTTTLAARVARLVADGHDPQRILLLTFTRRAAAEMTARATRMVAATGSRAPVSRLVSGTFHGIANRLLRQYADRIGLATDFGLLDAADAADLIDMVRDDLGVAKGVSRFPRKATLAAIYSRVVNSRVPLVGTLERHYPWCAEHPEAIGRIFREYGARKRTRNLLDYDDLLLFWKVLAEADGVGDELASSFDHVLVDEYQDTNGLQVDLIAAMRRHSDNLTVVGDDAQAVYGFRAASVRHIRDFPTQFPGAQVIRLEQSYRSTQPILDTANAVVADMEEAYAKTLFSSRIDGPRPRLHTCHDEADQTERVCDAVLDRREQGTPLSSQAVLFRTGHHSAHLEIELSRRNIPFVKFGGLKFLEAAHVKDLIALMRMMDNPDDELAWFRILQRLEGIGPGRARTIMQALDVGGLGVGRVDSDGGARGVIALRQRAADAAVHLPPAAEQAFTGLATALIEAAEVPSVSGQVQRLADWYGDVCALVFDDPAPRMADLEQLQVLAEGSGDRVAFVDDLVLDPPASTGDLAGPPLLDEDHLILSTIHSAKGLEWDTVHLLHASDGMIPSDMSTGDPHEIEEERRLLYVALTRPRHELDVYVPLRYHHQRFGSEGRHSLGQVSRFLQGPTRDTLEPVGPRAGQASVPVLAGGAAAQVDAVLDDLF